MMEITSAPNKGSGIETGRKSEAKAAFDFETEDASDKSFEAEYGKNENPPAASPDAQATQQKLEESRADDPRDPQLPEGAPQQPVELFGTKEAITGNSDLSDSSMQSTMLARDASQAIAPDSKDQIFASERPSFSGKAGADSVSLNSSPKSLETRTFVPKNALQLDAKIRGFDRASINVE